MNNADKKRWSDLLQTLKTHEFDDTADVIKHIEGVLLDGLLEETPEKKTPESKPLEVLTIKDVEDNIASEHYFTGFEGALGACKLNDDVRQETINKDWELKDSHETLRQLVLCVLVMRNKSVVVGSAFHFQLGATDLNRGRESARRDALQMVWEHMCFEWRSKKTAEMEAAK